MKHGRRGSPHPRFVWIESYQGIEWVCYRSLKWMPPSSDLSRPPPERGNMKCFQLAQAVSVSRGCNPPVNRKLASLTGEREEAFLTIAARNQILTLEVCGP